MARYNSKAEDQRTIEAMPAKTKEGSLGYGHKASWRWTDMVLTYAGHNLQQEDSTDIALSSSIRKIKSLDITTAVTSNSDLSPSQFF